MSNVALSAVPATQVPTAGAATFDVSKMATGGVGSYASPWTGWETPLQAAFAANSTFYFPSGVYGWSTTFNWVNFGNMHFKGELGTVLKYTGSGEVVKMAPTQACQIPAFNGAFGIIMENFLIDGTGTGTIGLHLKSIHHSTFRNIYMRDVTTKGLFTEFNILNTFDTLRFSTRVGNAACDNESDGVTIGLYLNHDGNPSNTTQACTFINTIVELNSGIGIVLGPGANKNTFSGGSSENNGGKNLVCYGIGNTLIDMDNEFSGDTDAVDFDILGSYTQLINCLSTGLLRIGNDVDGGDYVGNIISGGQYNKIHIDTNAKYTRVDSPAFNFLGSGYYKNDSALTVPFVSALAAPIDYSAKIPTTKIGLAVSDSFTGSTFGDQWFTDSFVADPPSASITSAISSNAFAITLPNTTAGTLFSGKANGGHAIIDTGFERIKHVSRPAAGSYNVYFSIGKSRFNRLYMLLSGGTLSYGIVSGGSGASFGSVSYNSVSMLYWRFLRVGADIKAQYSADASSWTDLGISTSVPFDFTNFRTCLEAGSTASSTYSAPVVFDDYVIG